MSQAAALPQSSGTTTGSSSISSNWRFVALGVGLLVVLGLYLLLTRSGGERITTGYGKRRGYEAADSVNGTSVLASMFTQAGHKVRTVTRLSPRIDKYDTIVWFPDDYAPPTQEQRDWLEMWLLTGSKRTLIYVGRDYDAESNYWADIQASAPPEQADELKRREATARSENDKARAAMPDEEVADWFTVRRDSPRREAKTLRGPWADGIDAEKASIVIEGTLEPPQEDGAASDGATGSVTSVETLLASNNDALVTRLRDPAYGDGQIIVVTNGSFLLNYPLVNHENRKIAARLVSEAEPGDVLFLESGEGGPDISDKDDGNSIPTGLDLIKVWPLNVILLHLTMLGIVYCIARWPIFGRPRELPADSTADFGKHISALGELLRGTKDAAYAQARLEQYRTQGKRESGKSHR
jgi:hypothetical protein